MKQRLALIGIGAALIVSMGGGFLTGYLYQSQWIDTWQMGEMSRWVIEMSGLSNDIALIDSGDIDTLRDDMNERIDRKIHMLDAAFSQDWSSRHALAASKVLAQVYAQRKQHPFMNDDHEMAATVKALLRDAAARWTAHQEASAVTAD